MDSVPLPSCVGPSPRAVLYTVTHFHNWAFCYIMLTIPACNFRSRYTVFWSYTRNIDLRSWFLFFFFFYSLATLFLMGLGFELRASHLQAWIICLSWPWTMTLQISASQVARIVGMSHQHLASLATFNTEHNVPNSWFMIQYTMWKRGNQMTHII
jgi:hypothetical protein